MSTKKSNGSESAEEKEITITRVINAPRELVFEAFEDPEKVVKWWGPTGFTTTIHERDFRVGGVWHQTMHGPDGKDYLNKSIFKEIVRPEKIVYQHAGGIKEKGGACFRGTWLFEDLGGEKTRLTITLAFPSSGAKEHTEQEYGAIQGGNQTLDRLEQLLAHHSSAGTDPSQEPFIISRVLKAPRELVWKAFTEPEKMKQWWGPKDFTVLVSKMDLTPGGMYHYGLKSPEGNQMWGRMIYREIVKPERIVFINSFSDEQGGITRHPYSTDPWPLEMHSTLTFQEHKDGTLLTVRWIPYNATEEERKSFDKGRPSMQQGWTGTLDQLTGYLGKCTV